MNELIINEIAKDLNVKVKQVETVLNLLSDGNTIPFIARYRKEATGALDEEEIRKIQHDYILKYNCIAPNGYNQTQDTNHPLNDPNTYKKIKKEISGGLNYDEK